MRLFLTLLFVLALSIPTDAQQPKKVPRIGYLSAGSASLSLPRLEAFRQGLRGLGYMEGKNIVIEYRYSEGRIDRLPALAAKLVREKVEVIVTVGTDQTQAARRASDTIPVVMTFVADSIGSGFVASLARPGGNITGLTNLAPELSGKWLELLKEMVPKSLRVGVLMDPVTPGAEGSFEGDGGHRKGVGCGSSTFRGPKAWSISKEEDSSVDSMNNRTSMDVHAMLDVFNEVPAGF